MNAPDFTARALALRAMSQRPAPSPMLFSELRSAKLPVHVDRVDSIGHGETGVGAATYIADELATAELAQAHPSACFADSGGRFFRLMGDAAGRIAPEQVGCPPYAAGTNQQPYIQAAVDYAVAVGLSGVVFPAPRYELWAPPRISPYIDHAANDGNFIVIEGRVSLLGTHSRRTWLHCKGPKGGSLLTDYQIVSGPIVGAATTPGDLIWRGSAIKITGSAYISDNAVPDEELNSINIERLVLFSDAIGVQNSRWPAMPPSRMPDMENAWDITNKGIHFEQNRQIGIVRAREVEITGFLGECVYTNGFGKGGFIGRDLVIKHSNGQALNSNGPDIFEVSGLYAENCSFSLEGWAGLTRGKIVDATFRNMKSGGITGGNGWAGDRRPDGTKPTLYVDARFENCRDLYPGSNIHGRLTLIDTQLALVTPVVTQVLQNIDLDVTTICDSNGGMTAIRIGPAGGAPPRSIRDIDIRLHCLRTREAREAGRGFNTLLAQSGSLGPNINIHVSGEARQAGVIYGAALPDFYVALKDRGLELTDTTGPAMFDARGNPAPLLGLRWLRAVFGGEQGLFPIRLPANALQFNAGAEVTFEHRDSSSKQAVLDVGGLALLPFGGKVTLTADKYRNRWIVSEPAEAYVTRHDVSIPATAAGGLAGPFGLPMQGARAEHDARVVPAGPVAGYVVEGVSSDSDTIRFWLRNRGEQQAAMTAKFAATLRPAA